MANINKAMNWLKTGKRIRKSNWDKDSYWYMEEDYSIMYADRTKAVVHPNQILSDDWEIWEKERTLSDELSELFIWITCEHAPNLSCINVADKIKKIFGDRIV